MFTAVLQISFLRKTLNYQLTECFVISSKGLHLQRPFCCARCSAFTGDTNDRLIESILLRPPQFFTGQFYDHGHCCQLKSYDKKKKPFFSGLFLLCWQLELLTFPTFCVPFCHLYVMLIREYEHFYNRTADRQHVFTCAHAIPVFQWVIGVIWH